MSINATRTAKKLIKDHELDPAAVRQEMFLEEDSRIGTAEVRRFLEKQDEEFTIESPEEFKNAAFPVALEPTFTRSPDDDEKLQEIPNRRAIVRQDTGAILNIVSDRYKLVRHMDVFEPVAEAIEDLGLGVKERQVAIGMDGGYARTKWVLDEPALIDEDDQIDYAITVRNSYNYESIMGIELGAVRLICTNGLTAGVTDAFAGGKHMKNLSVHQALSDIREVLEQKSQVVEQYRTWAEVEFTPESLQSWLEDDQRTIPNKAHGDIVEYFQQRQATLWEAYNALTWYATHKLDQTSRRAPINEDNYQKLALDFALTAAG